MDFITCQGLPPANSSTPFLLDVVVSEKTGAISGFVSEEITFNSNDGLSFSDDVDSSIDQDDDGTGNQQPPAPKIIVQGQERHLQITSPPTTAQPYEAGADSDSESLMTHNEDDEHSHMEGLDDFGILLDAKINNQQLPPKNPIHRPSGATGSARSLTRSASGIPRPIRSRSNSMTSSNDSGGQSRRNSDESSSRYPTVPPERVDMDRSFDCFVQSLNSLKYYNPGVVNTVLLSLEKKMTVTNINAEFMVNIFVLLSIFEFFVCLS